MRAIGTNEKCRQVRFAALLGDDAHVRYMAAFWGNADISQRLPDDRD
jgi:hypothetical protein